MTAPSRAMRAFDVACGPLLAGAFVALFAAEARWPLRRRVEPRARRLARNAVLAGIGGVVARFAVVPALVRVARAASKRRIGLVRLLPLPPVVASAAAFVLLDASTYAWHRLNHVVPLLWRFHRMHHADLDLDVSTALRFHVGELLASIVFRGAAVAAIGASPGVLVGYDVVMQLANEAQHANVRLPPAVDAAMAKIVVSPRMHGIHHSIAHDEVNANWSVVFSIWDRLFATLRLDVAQDAIVIGLPDLQTEEEVTLGKMLTLPFFTA